MAKPIAPCLWFDSNAEEAVKFYCSIFKDSEIVAIDRYTELGPGPEGSIMFIEFMLNGQDFQAINGGPEFTFSEAISLSVVCADQEEVDYYWDTLLAGGGKPSQCGWLTDRFGLSWQVYPAVLNEMIRDSDRVKANKALKAMFQMVKFDVAQLQKAYDG